MIAHGYTIETACDGKFCKKELHREMMGSFYGNNKRDAFAAVRRAGWKVLGFHCLCPICVSKGEKLDEALIDD